MAKRPRDADAVADADADSTHSAVRIRRVLPRPLPPRPVEQIVAAESAKAERGPCVSATIDDNDSNQWDAYYTARYLRFNANTGGEETNGSTEDGHAITNDVLAITDIARTASLGLTADEETYVARCYQRYKNFWSPLVMALLVETGKRNSDGSRIQGD